MPRQRGPTTSSHKSSGWNPNWKMLLNALLLALLPAISTSLPALFCHCSTYECYVWLKIVPLALSTLSVVLLALILLMKFACCKCECNTCTKVVKWYWDKASSLTEVVFKHFLIEDDNNRKVFDAFGYEASHENMPKMSIILLQAIVQALGQLWDEFLIEESYICSSTDPCLHCFSTSTNQKLNCQNLSAFENNETSITWYKYVFNIGHAAASAIGIISATGLIIYIVGLVSLKLFNRISCRKSISIVLRFIVMARFTHQISPRHFPTSVAMVMLVSTAVVTLCCAMLINALRRSITGPHPWVSEGMCGISLHYNHTLL